MKRPKHCAHAIGGLQTIRRMVAIGTVPQIRLEDIDGAIADIRAAQKFLLPDDGRLLHAKPERIREWMAEHPRLPFPITALEFDTPTSITAADIGARVDAMVVVARQAPESQKIVVLSCIRYAQNGKFGGDWIPADEIEYDPTTGEFHNAAALGLGAEDAGQDATKADCLTRVAVSAITELLAALACSNTRVQVAAGTERRHWSESRRERELPHFVYHELVLEAPRQPGQASAPGGGHHASPRQHLRRGHIRRYASGQTIWINAMVVGDASRGVVDKHYRVRNRTQESTR